jgi:hypothetical protein
VNTRIESAARRSFLKDALRTALRRHVPRMGAYTLGTMLLQHIPSNWRESTKIYFTTPLIASAQPEAKLGPGPRCRFCTKLLSSAEWQLERCMKHYDVDIARCPATPHELKYWDHLNPDR